MSVFTKPYPSSSSPEAMPMPKPQISEAVHSQRGPMPNENRNTRAIHPNGDPMPQPADPTEAIHSSPNGGPMPNEDNRAAHDLNPNGDPMTTNTYATEPVNPNPHGALMPIEASATHTAPPNPHGDSMPTPDDTTEPIDPTHTGAPMTTDPPDDFDEPIPDTLRMLTPEDAARAVLNGVVGSLGRDEVRVLTRIAQRLQVGSKLYGPFYLATDARVFRDTEARQELEDALVYLACAWLKAEHHQVVTR